MNRQTVGFLGERAARVYLRSRGYRIVCSNFRVRGGEIDIICENAEFLVFAEVKTRSPNPLVSGLEAVSAKKRARLVLAAKVYLATHASEKQPRFDVVEVLSENGRYSVAEHIESAFGEY